VEAQLPFNSILVRNAELTHQGKLTVQTKRKINYQLRLRDIIVSQDGNSSSQGGNTTEEVTEEEASEGEQEGSQAV